MKPLLLVFVLIVPLLATFPTRHAGATDLVIFQANFDPPPDCLPVDRVGCPGFVMETPPVSVESGFRIAFCYYFRTPNTGALPIGRISSIFEPPTEFVELYLTYDLDNGEPADRYSPGSVITDGCGIGAQVNNTFARLIYSSDAPGEQLRMPDDDGNGNPLAIELPANSAGFVKMYFFNTTPDPISTLVRVTFNGLAGATPYTKTSTYTGYAFTIQLPPSVTTTVTNACDVPSGVKFWRFSTQTYSHATYAAIQNTGGGIIVSSPNWQSPQVATFGGPTFYQFGAGEQMKYSCTYYNDTGSFIYFGESYESDETCYAVGYYFPADRPEFCLDSTGPY